MTPIIVLNHTKPPVTTMRLSAVGKFGQAWEFLSKNAATDGAGIVDCQYNIQRGNEQERNIKAVSIFKASSMV